MMKKLSLLVATFLATLTLLAPVSAFAQTGSFAQASADDACQALKDFNPDDKGCGDAQDGVNSIIRTAITLLSIIAGIIAVIMLIVSGLKFITSEGDASKAASARQSLIYAIVGLVVVVVAQVIVRFVLGNLN